MSQSYLQTCRHVCCILIMPKPLYKSSDATEEVSALTEEMASTNSWSPTGPTAINTACRFLFFFFLWGENELFEFCLFVEIGLMCTHTPHTTIKRPAKDKLRGGNFYFWIKTLWWLSGKKKKKTLLPFINGLRNRVIMPFKTQNDKKKKEELHEKFVNATMPHLAGPCGETVAGMAGRQIEILYFDCSWKKNLFKNLKPNVAHTPLPHNW